jgi:hypothetical protein
MLDTLNEYILTLDILCQYMIFMNLYGVFLSIKIKEGMKNEKITYYRCRDFYAQHFCLC